MNKPPSDKLSRVEKAVLGILYAMGRMPRAELVSMMEKRFKMHRSGCYAALWFMEKRHFLRRTPAGLEALAVRGIRVHEASKRRTIFA